MKRILAFVLFSLLFAVPVHAVPSEFKLHWDDNPLNAGKTLHTKVYWRSDQTEKRTDAKSYEIPGFPARSITLADLMAATNLIDVDGLYFSVTFTDRLSAGCLTARCESGYSNEEQFVNPVPAAPENVRTVTVTVTVTVGP